MSNIWLSSNKNDYNVPMNRKGFTLIEVLVATAIASVALIGTFFLLQSSFRQSQWVLVATEFEEVFLNTRNCILMQNIPSLSGATGSVRYTTNGCTIDGYSSDLSFTGTSIWQFDQGIPSVKKDYYSYFMVYPGTNSGAYTIDHYLVSDAQKGYRQYEAYR